VSTRILITSIVANVALTLLKIVGGLVSGSAGLVADGFHSLTDVISMVVNFFGIRISESPAVGLEAYDNYRKEILGTLAVSFALFAVGLFILVRSYLNLTTGIAHSPGLGASLIVIVAFLITWRLYAYSKNESGKSDSPGLAVNTEQIKLNVLSTAAVLVGIIGSCFDMNYLDAVAAMFVALIIIYSSISIVVRFRNEIEGARLTREQVDQIKRLVAELDTGARVARIKTMVIRKKIWLFLELAGLPAKTPGADFAQDLKRNLLAGAPYLDDVIIGATPWRRVETMRVEIEDFALELAALRNTLGLVFIVAIVSVASAAAFGVSFASKEYTVLIPADSPDVSAQVSPLLGRARYFYVYRVDRKKGRFLENRLAQAPAEIDHHIARMFKSYCIEAVVTRKIGPLIFEHLNSAGIGIYRAEPGLSIARQIERFEQERRTRLSKPNAEVKFGLRNMKLLSPWYNWQRI
jgi:cation diffusion facilitator family transporter